MQRDGQASAFARRVNPQGIALAILNTAIWLKRDEEYVSDIRIAVGPSGPIPMRMPNTEKVMIGQVPSLELQAHAIEVLLEEARFRTSPHRATAEYRRHLAEVLFHEAISLAWHRAK